IGRKRQRMKMPRHMKVINSLSMRRLFVHKLEGKSTVRSSQRIRSHSVAAELCRGGKRRHWPKARSVRGFRFFIVPAAWRASCVGTRGWCADLAVGAGSTSAQAAARLAVGVRPQPITTRLMAMRTGIEVAGRIPLLAQRASVTVFVLIPTVFFRFSSVD
ncbi:hypothetical protein, partial [Blastopirellula marina]|uniref:hypothetical protein n=1 Tax=Blastopirellula marina TaxID=124 RepID=UPI001F4857C9